jgi:hypothetical protein
MSTSPVWQALLVILVFAQQRAPKPEPAPERAPDEAPLIQEALATAPASVPPSGLVPDAAPALFSPLIAPSLTHIGEKVGLWTKDDADKELGPAIARRDAWFNGKVVGDIFKYNYRQERFAAVELSFHRDSQRLVAAYFYYSNLMSWSVMRTKLGKNYKKIKMSNGRPGYLYQFQQRQLFVVVDSSDFVVNLGLW